VRTGCPGWLSHTRAALNISAVYIVLRPGFQTFSLSHQLSSVYNSSISAKKKTVVKSLLISLSVHETFPSISMTSHEAIAVTLPQHLSRPTTPSIFQSQTTNMGLDSGQNCTNGEVEGSGRTALTHPDPHHETMVVSPPKRKRGSDDHEWGSSRGQNSDASFCSHRGGMSVTNTGFERLVTEAVDAKVSKLSERNDAHRQQTNFFYRCAEPSRRSEVGQGKQYRNARRV
jgi:hypothetical protein